ncbi:cytochrome C oxidase subunit IV family protein [Horticoccus luteus]|uniref:Cytochrome C oxidase subunit IV family protein n=1 Tax=Horticoccus luteus TaxID=2862869 RepID=A0A8F9TTK7_9BACT|nr:cytochrome C oxidase subunit IV family protein [Horticoccus luteus]QYM78811.1 cytochrome C oxidase subunit IV family protein [Horticoccus luteus]
MKTEPQLSVRAIFGVFIALMVLLALTALADYLPPSRWALPISLTIAVAKMALIFLFFMHLRYQRGMVRIAAAAGFFWLAILLTLTFGDYLTRGWVAQ